MIIRPLTNEDYSALYALWLKCEGMGLNDVDDSPAGIARYLARNPGTSFAAEEDGARIGAIMAGHDGRRGTIHHTAVHPDYRGRGAGKALVEHALAALKAEGIQCAVFSNKADALCGGIIAHYFGTERFDAVRGSRPGVPTKPDPTGLYALMTELGADPAATLFVGDSDVDILTGHNAQLPAMGALWGFRGRAELTAAGADALAEVPADILRYVQEQNK